MADKALLVGINDYPSAPLKGCVNDALDMADLITTRYGFNPSGVRLLCDKRATTNGIKQRLHWLCDAGPGDRILFHFSGHGVQVTSRDKYTHEIDGLDETICPYDFDWSAKRRITDTWFYRFFRKKVAKGVRFYWIADCCHSGTMTRSLTQVEQVPRQYPVPADLLWRQRSIDEKGIENKSRALVRGKLDVGFVAGCMDRQTSADTSIGGRPCGALTSFFIANLKRMPKRTTLTKIVATTALQLKKKGYPQVPQADGARKRKPFLA